MDTVSIITGLGLVALITLPFIFHYLHKKNKDIKFMKDLISLAEREKAIISQKEFWRECYAIGIDDISKKLLYIHKRKDKELRTLIDLSAVERCRIVNVSRMVKTQNSNNNVLDRLELVFSFQKSDIPEEVLEFYDSSEFMTTDGELPLIEKWLGIINSNLKTSKSNL